MVVVGNNAGNGKDSGPIGFNAILRSRGQQSVGQYNVSELEVSVKMKDNEEVQDRTWQKGEKGMMIINCL